MVKFKTSVLTIASSAAEPAKKTPMYIKKNFIAIAQQVSVFYSVKLYPKTGFSAAVSSEDVL